MTRTNSEIWDTFSIHVTEILKTVERRGDRRNNGQTFLNLMKIMNPQTKEFKKAQAQET